MSEQKKSDLNVGTVLTREDVDRLSGGTRETMTSFTIPDGVTSIGIYAFEGCASLINVTIPHGVTSIGYKAFEECASLTNVTIPNSVTLIEFRAFTGCKSLTRVAIPDSVVSIGRETFSECDSLEEVILPKDLKIIETYAFAYCKSLTYVRLPENLKEIHWGAFIGCVKLSHLDLPAHLEAIQDYAFTNCVTLTRLALPTSLTSLSSTAFQGCPAIVLEPEPGSYSESKIKEIQNSPEIIKFLNYYDDGSASKREKVFDRWGPERSIFPTCAVAEWKNSKGQEMPPRTGQIYIIAVQYPFNCRVGQTFRTVFSPQDRFSDGCILPDCETGYVDSIWLVKGSLLKIIQFEAKQAIVQIRVLKVSCLKDFIGKQTVQMSGSEEYLEEYLKHLEKSKQIINLINRSNIHFLNVDFDIAREPMFYNDYEYNFWGDFDEYGWELKQETLQGEYGTDILIYTDFYGIDHMVVRSKWGFDDGANIQIGNVILGDHRARLQVLHTLRMIWVKKEGKFSYETPWYGRHEWDPPIMYLVEYRPDGAFQDMDTEIIEAFGGIRCALIGYFAVQSNALRALVLPRTLEKIYDFAFTGCPALQWIIIPDGCEFRFERRAFEGCAENLTFSAVPGSPVIPALKRFGYRVEERPAATMDNAALRAHTAVPLETKGQPGQPSALHQKNPD